LYIELFSEIANKKVISKHKVGKYSVFVEDFEKIALPIFEDHISSTLIIDEIGKMELLSEKFERQMKKIMADVKSNKKSMIATIPSSPRGRPIALVEELKAINSAKMFEITKSNRNTIYNQIFDDTKKLLNLK
jgi:nucleoside-triphosphatase